MRKKITKKTYDIREYFRIKYDIMLLLSKISRIIKGVDPIILKLF